MSTPAPRKKRSPKKPKTLPAILVTKESVAVSQLETAVMLWFADGDPVSIHTLAAAANDCFHALCEERRKPSTMIRGWMQDGTRRKVKWKLVRHQNFFKHGWRDIKREVTYPIGYGEYLMLDSILCYEILFDEVTPLMRAFAARFLLARPWLFSEEATAFLLEGYRINEVAKLKRAEFLKKVLPLFAQVQGGFAPRGLHKKASVLLGKRR